MADAAIVRAFYDAWAGGDVEAMLETLAADVEFVNPAYAVEPGTRYGRDGFGKAVDRLDEMVDISTVEVEELADAGDKLVAIVRATGRARAAGIPVDTRIAHVWTLRDGLIARLEWFLDADEGYAAAGIARPDVPLGELGGGPQP